MKWAWLALLLVACGTVSSSSDGIGVAGGTAGAAGGSTGASGGRDSAAGSGGEAAAGASGAAGDAGGRGGDPGTGGAGGHVGVSTAPVCKGTEIGGPECPRIADPAYPDNPNAGWQCLLNCSDTAADNATGCVFSGVTYCVSSCSLCRY
jgi:hypothetical protein